MSTSAKPASIFTLGLVVALAVVGSALSRGPGPLLLDHWADEQTPRAAVALATAAPPRRDPRLVAGNASSASSSSPSSSSSSSSSPSSSPVSAPSVRPPPPPCRTHGGVNRAFRLVGTALSSAVSLLGIAGNAALLRFVYKDTRPHSGRNHNHNHLLILIGSLALGDLLNVVLNIPINVYKLHAQSWQLGAIVCKLAPFMQKSTLGITALSLCALSVDRYLTIALRNYVQGTGTPPLLCTALTILAIWSLSPLLAVPELVSFNVLSWNYGNRTLNTCIVIQDTSFVKFYIRAKDWWLFGFYLCMPVACAAVFYTLTTSKMHGMKKATPRLATIDKQLEQQWEAARTVLCLVVVFALCWLPLHVSRILKRSLYNEMDPDRCELLSTLLVLNYIGMNLANLSSCINPIALYFVNKRFKNYFKVLCCYQLRFCRRGRAEIMPTPVTRSSRKSLRLTTRV